MASYTDVAQVRRYSGLQARDIEDADLTEMIQDASQEIDEMCGNPRTIRNEIYKGDNESTRFRIGGRVSDAPKSIENVLRTTLYTYEGSPASVFEPHYPESPDDWTYASSDWTAGSGTGVTLDTSTYKNGASCIHMSGTTGGIVSYPTDKNINVGITNWQYIFLNFKTDASTFTMRLMEDASNYRSQTITPEYSDVWENIFIDVTNMTETGSPTILNYIEFDVGAAENLRVDGIILNEGYGLESPSSDFGYINFQTAPTRFAIDYNYNPFTPTPRDIALATAYLVASYAFEYLSGERLKETSGNIQIDDMEPIRDDFRGLSGQSWRFRKLATNIIERRGYDFETLFVDEEW